MRRVANHDPEDRLPAYIQNVVDGKTTTNYGAGIPINDGSTPAKNINRNLPLKMSNGDLPTITR
jgi:DNA (cytosine-5)-methyltransferase 1